MEASPQVSRVRTAAHDGAPAPSLSASVVLSGRRAQTVITHTGAGYARYDDLAVTRYSGGLTPDADGVFVYLRDLETGTYCSAGLQPAGNGADQYDALLTETQATIRRHDDGIQIVMDVQVDDDIEFRRITMHNASGRRRWLELTSYLEWVLQDAAADASHPAFSKLFIETEVVAPSRLIVARRRAREPNQGVLTGGHWIARTHHADDAPPQFETSRLQFIGRGRSLRDPAAMDRGTCLSGTAGPVLDPIASLRQNFILAPNESAIIVLALAARRDEAGLRALVRPMSATQVDDLFCPAVPASDLDGDADRMVQPIQPPRGNASIHRAQELRVDPPHTREAPIADDFRPLREPGVADRSPAAPAAALQFHNGFGGFSAAGDEYVIRLRPDVNGRVALPPLPWTHVVANQTAGFIATETGAGYTWTINSRENRLTPWRNDPVRDPHSEAWYLRDLDRGVYWSPTPGPAGPPVAHEVRYGFGFARYEQTSASLRQCVESFVPLDDSLKITRLQVTNLTPLTRRLDLLYFARLDLGNGSLEQSSGIRTWFDESSQAMFAANPGRALPGRVAFAKLLTSGAAEPVSHTGDSADFLGTYGDLSAPLAVRRAKQLSGRPGHGSDACAGLQTAVEIPGDQKLECWVLLGEADDEDAARALLRRYSTAESVAAAAQRVRQFWTDTLSAVRIDTPSPALNLMVNGWLPYQNLSCRMWGRSAYYQSGGAYGFRDQLQDSAALVYHSPALTRRQILRHASAQFVEGDVLHWWHEPGCRGIRTRFADDLLWLPLVAAEYFHTTGDAAVWDEVTPFLAGPALEDGEDERFIAPSRSSETGSVYQHACRAIDRSLTVGAHGLPLFGTGDWNDGMNRVGRLGRGESVWMGFFLYYVLERMIPICVARGDSQRADFYREHQTRLRAALNGSGWDGHWFRRGFFDDRTPLGAAGNDECQIDALAQAWAVISGAGDAEFCRKGVAAVERRLVDEQAGLIRLLDPPFNRMANDPGYIKGYLPGIRENGGQYTHGVLWFVRAVAEQGRGTRAVELLDMINPINHARTADEVAVYQAEPYVVAADVYSVAPHVGRAGWTWYTGSAGWMFRVAVESILGLRIHEGREFVLNPCISSEWPRCQLALKIPNGGEYRIAIENPAGRECGVRTASLDGKPAWVEDGSARIPLLADGRRHDVVLHL